MVNGAQHNGGAVVARLRKMQPEDHHDAAVETQSPAKGAHTAQGEYQRMKTIKKSAPIRRARNFTFDPPLRFTWEYMAYQTPEEMKAAGDVFTPKQQVALKNKQRSAAARSKAQNEYLDSFKKEDGETLLYPKQTSENNPLIALKGMFKMLRGVKLPNGEPFYSVQQAMDLAATNLQKEWPKGYVPPAVDGDDDEDDEEDDDEDNGAE